MYSTIALIALPVAISFIHADDKHSYASVNDLVLQNIIYCPERLKLNLDWQGAIPGFSASAGQPHWRLGSVGMAQARQLSVSLSMKVVSMCRLLTKWLSCCSGSW